MKNLYKKIVDSGVHDGIPILHQKRLRSANFLELCSLFFYFVYLALGIMAASKVLIVTTGGMILGGLAGLLMNRRRRYSFAKALLINSFSTLLLFCCNGLGLTWDFAIFYMPATFFSIMLFDFGEDLARALANLIVYFTCVFCVFLLPSQLFMKETLAPQWQSFFHRFNYLMAFAAAFGYVFFMARHMNKTSKVLVRAWTEAERQKEAYLDEKNKAEAVADMKSQFLSNMSHELRTPLNGIIGTVQLLLEEKVSEGQKDHFKVLKYTSEHMLSLVSDVLDFSKIEAGQMDVSNVPFNLAESMQKLQTVFAKQFAERGIHLIFDIPSSFDREFMSDETRLAQVLTNLLGNALKFSRQGMVKCSLQLVSSGSHSAEVRFAVEDNGIGISTEQQQRIFDAFRQAELSSTRSFGGTGLGLTISKNIVKMLGGDLQVDSQLGKGSCFYFTIDLPYSQRKTIFAGQEKGSALRSLKGARVLMADDNFVNRKITRSFLNKWQVEMDEASDGKEALQLFFSKKYDLLLIDLHMPVMDGYETIAAIRKVDPDISALAFTAAVMPDMRKKLTDYGFTDFLQKPFRPEELHHKITTSCALSLS